MFCKGNKTLDPIIGAIIEIALCDFSDRGTKPLERP
jgi:hypothetical protein